MILTVKEAKTKWCPKYQIAAGTGHIFTNRLEKSSYGVGCKCIADGCMAWREITREEHNGTYYPCKERKGYCGLAGKPEGVI